MDENKLTPEEKKQLNIHRAFADNTQKECRKMLADKGYDSAQVEMMMSITGNFTTQLLDVLHVVGLIMDKKTHVEMFTDVLTVCAKVITD